MKWNEWGFRPPLRTYRLAELGQEKLLMDDEMNDMTMPSRHRILNSSTGDLRLSTLPLSHGGYPHNWIFESERGRNILFLWNLNARAGFEPAISDFPSRQLLYQFAPGPLPLWSVKRVKSSETIISVIKQGSKVAPSDRPRRPTIWEGRVQFQWACPTGRVTLFANY